MEEILRAPQAGNYMGHHKNLLLVRFGIINMVSLNIFSIKLTQKSGSGKTYLSNMLACKLVAEAIDIDNIAHEVMDSAEMKQKIRAKFGASVFCGLKIDRKKLGEILFADKQKLEYVE